MTYSTSAPPKLLVPSFTNTTGEVSIWSYYSTDAAATIDASGYITNAKSLGMKAGDLVFSTDSDASPQLTSLHRVVAVNTNGSADLSDASASNSTNTD